MPSRSARFFAKTAGVATTTRTDRSDHHPDPPPHPRDAARAPARSWSIRCRSRSRCAGSSRARPRRARMHALAEYGLMHVKLYEDIARHGHIATTYDYPVRVAWPLSDGPVADPEIRQSQARRLSGAATVRRGPREAHLRDAALYARRIASISRIIRSSAPAWSAPARSAAPSDRSLDEVVIDDQGGAHVRLLRHRLLRTRSERGGRE